MSPIELKLNDRGRGEFTIEENGERIAEMGIGIVDGNLTVYHTEVSEKLQGQGIAKKMLDAMVDYARKNNLKVIALCPYTYTTFSRHPEQYTDIWLKHIKGKGKE